MPTPTCWSHRACGEPRPGQLGRERRTAPSPRHRAQPGTPTGPGVAHPTGTGPPSRHLTSYKPGPLRALASFSSPLIRLPELREPAGTSHVVRVRRRACSFGDGHPLTQDLPVRPRCWPRPSATAVAALMNATQTGDQAFDDVDQQRGRPPDCPSPRGLVGTQADDSCRPHESSALRRTGSLWISGPGARACPAPPTPPTGTEPNREW